MNELKTLLSDLKALNKNQGEVYLKIVKTENPAVLAPFAEASKKLIESIWWLEATVMVFNKEEKKDV